MPSTVRNLATVIGKASVLLEAMPYLQAFQGKVFVIKSGGTALKRTVSRSQFLQDLLFLSLAGIHPVLVHGGGAEISDQMRSMGHIPRFVEGLRVTDGQTLKVVQETLEQVNKRLVAELKRFGGQAMGLSGTSRQVLQAERQMVNGQDIGLVGKIKKVNPRPIHDLLQKGKIPVIVPLARGTDGQTYNVNADQAAASLAGALRAEKFVLMTDVEGILRDEDDPRSLISTVSVHEVEKLIAKGIVKGGMIPKARACMSALRAGVIKTHIIDMEIPHGLLLEIFTDRGIGTQIIK